MQEGTSGLQLGLQAAGQGRALPIEICEIVDSNFPIQAATPYLPGTCGTEGVSIDTCGRLGYQNFPGPLGSSSKQFSCSVQGNITHCLQNWE